MPEIPNINGVLETFVFYWYENCILDPKKLQLLFSSDFKIQCQTTSANETSVSNYYPKFLDVSHMIEQYIMLKDKQVTNAEIVMWTPTILNDGYQVNATVNWKNEADKLILTSTDVFYMQRVLSSPQQRGLCIKAFTSHILYQ